MDLVTGASGFIGAHLIRELIARGVRVRTFDRAPYPADEPVQPDEQVMGDICDREGLQEAMQGCECVYHLAANPNLWDRDPSVFDRVNRQGTENVLEAFRRSEVSRMIYTSTESILVPRNHQRPVTEDVQPALEDMIGPYCRSKFLAEQAAMEAARQGQEVIIVNPTMPIGPGDRNLTPPGRMIRDFLLGRITGYIDTVFNFVDVRDAAVGHVLAAEQGVPGRRYLLAGENLHIREFFELLGRLTDKPFRGFRVPRGVALAAAYVEEAWGRVTGRTPLSSVTGIKLSRRSLAFDGSATWQSLGGHTPRPLEESAADAVAWHRERLAQDSNP